MPIRIANREDPDQTALQKQSDLGLHCLSRPFWQEIVFEILEHLPYFIFSLSEDNCLYKLERVNIL